MNKQNAAIKAKVHFDAHPELKVMYCTKDGKLFFAKGDADHHATAIGQPKKEVLSILREQAEIIAEMYSGSEGTGEPPVAPVAEVGTGEPPVAPVAEVGTGEPPVAPVAEEGAGEPPVAPVAEEGAGEPPVAPPVEQEAEKKQNVKKASLKDSK